MPIFHLHKPSFAELDKATKIGQPMLITGILDTWPEVMRWTPDYLKEEHGERVIHLNKNITEQEPNHMISARLGDYVDWLHLVEKGVIKHKNNYYFAESFSFLDSLGMESAVDKRFKTMMPKGVKNSNALKAYAFWMGPQGSVTGFHYDTDHRNYLAQICGRKEFLLVDPKNIDSMYPSSRYEKGSNVSLVDYWQGIDHQKYPRFKDVVIKRIILHPGQMLYVPAKWWHAVKNLDTNVAVSLRHETLFTNYIIGAVEELRHLLHRLGVVGSKDNCVCHAEGVYESLPGMSKAK